jgi:glycyl-tRNA synthetase alpha chain
LDARGVISVTERAAYIGRVRALAKACCEAWLAGSPGSSENILSRTAGEGGRGAAAAVG